MQDTFTVSHVLIAQGRDDLTDTRWLMLPELVVGLDQTSVWPLTDALFAPVTWWQWLDPRQTSQRTNVQILSPESVAVFRKFRDLT